MEWCLTLGKRKRREESKVDITSFLFESQEEIVKGDKESEAKAIVNVLVVDNDIETQLINFIRSQGKVEKSKVYRWSKEKEITPASLYKALVSLERKGLIRKEFDESVEELVYIAV